MNREFRSERELRQWMESEIRWCMNRLDNLFRDTKSTTHQAALAGIIGQLNGVVFESEKQDFAIDEIAIQKHGVIPE